MDNIDNIPDPINKEFTRILSDEEVFNLHKNGEIETLILYSIKIVNYVMKSLHIIYNREAFFSAGLEALVKAANTWNPNCNIRFFPFCYFKIKDALLAEMPYASGSVLSFTKGNKKSSRSAINMQLNAIIVLHDPLSANDKPLIDALPDSTNTLEEYMHQEDIQYAIKINEELRKVFSDIEVDSVMYPFKKFHQLYSKVTEKQHDNLRMRSLYKFRRYINEGYVHQHKKDIYKNIILNQHSDGKIKEKLKSKRCARCQKIKTIEHFTLKLHNKDGYNYYCKECIKKWKKMYSQTPKGKRKIKIYSQSHRIYKIKGD